MAFADRIVLNKLDLVNAEELAAVKVEIESINHTAQIIETNRRLCGGGGGGGGIKNAHALSTCTP